jgi:hypothetical protein
MDGQISAIITNTKGYFEKKLIRSSEFNPEMTYRFVFKNLAGKVLFRKEVKIPDQISCAFDDLEKV